jgi:outer membrane protein TolC
LILLITTSIFGLKLTDSIQEVIDSNPQLKLKKLELKKFKSQRASAWGSLLPTLNASTKYNQVIDTTTKDGITEPTYSDYAKGIQFNRELVANWNIFNGFLDTYKLLSKNEQIQSA